MLEFGILKELVVTWVNFMELSIHFGQKVYFFVDFGFVVHEVGHHYIKAMPGHAAKVVQVF